MRKIALLALMASTVVAATLAPFDAASAAETVTADVAPTATIVGTGEAADIEVVVTCPKKHQVLEAFVYITQDGNTSQFSGIGIRKCKGKPVTYTVRVRAFDDTPFHPGPAAASSYVLVASPDGTSTLSGGESQPVTLLP